MIDDVLHFFSLPTTMFEAPLDTRNETGVYHSGKVLTSKFAFGELGEIKRRQSKRTDPYVHDSTLVATLPYSGNDKKRKRKETSLGEGEDYEYRGLYSGIIYDHDGTVKDRVKLNEEVTTTATPSKRQHRRTQVATPYDLQMNGYESLPRPVTPLRVTRDSSGTLSAQLSARAQRVVVKNRHPDKAGERNVTQKSVYETVLGGLKADSMEDYWLYRSLKLRHSHIVSSLMHGAMLRKDYALASRAFALLIRSKNVNIRLVWTIGLELLVWRQEIRDQERLQEQQTTCHYITNSDDVHTCPHGPNDRLEDEAFLNWLIINFPYDKRYKSRKRTTRVTDRAPEMYPYLLLSKLRHSNPKQALEKMEEIMLQTPYSDDAIYDAYCGIATIQLMTATQEKLEREALCWKAKDYFDKCLQKGGVLPQDFFDYELNAMGLARYARGNGGDDDSDSAPNYSSDEEEHNHQEDGLEEQEPKDEEEDSD